MSRSSGNPVYTYDVAGRLATITYPKGQTSTFTYFLDNTLQQGSYANASSPNVSGAIPAVV